MSDRPLCNRLFIWKRQHGHNERFSDRLVPGMLKSSSERHNEINASIYMYLGNSLFFNLHNHMEDL